MDQSALNKINRLTLGPILSNIPLNHELQSVLPKFLRLFDPIAKYIFGVDIHHDKLDDFEIEWVSRKTKNDNMKRSGKVILYFHGGGFIALSPVTHRPITSYLAKKSGARVAAVDYRKTPKNKFPSQIEDGINAYNHLLSMGYKNTDISFAGDSAGGNLAVTVALKARDLGLPLPSSICAISPWTDLTVSGDSHEYNRRVESIVPWDRIKKVAEIYHGDHSNKDPLVSPIYADFKEFPPVHIEVGEYEVMLSDSINLHKRILETGGTSSIQIWKNGSHVFHVWHDFVPDGRDSLKAMCRFMEKYWSQL